MNSAQDDIGIKSNKLLGIKLLDRYVLRQFFLATLVSIDQPGMSVSSSRARPTYGVVVRNPRGVATGCHDTAHTSRGSGSPFNVIGPRGVSATSDRPRASSRTRSATRI